MLYKHVELENKLFKHHIPHSLSISVYSLFIWDADSIPAGNLFQISVVASSSPFIIVTNATWAEVRHQLALEPWSMGFFDRLQRRKINLSVWVNNLFPLTSAMGFGKLQWLYRQWVTFLGLQLFSPDRKWEIKTTHFL